MAEPVSEPVELTSVPEPRPEPSPDADVASRKAGSPRPTPGDPDFKQEDAIFLSAAKGGFYTGALTGVGGYLDDRAAADMAQVGEITPATEPSAYV
jgi:hypothetical protein